MKLSVIIPVYNVEKYLDRCVLSALSLSCDKEIILVDDGSTDASGELCDVWAKKDRRVRVIHRKNAGLSAARNVGISAATGDYILLLDADDLLDPVETDRLLSSIDPEAELAVGLYKLYFEDGERLELEPSLPPLIYGTQSRDELLRRIPPDGSSFYLTAWRFVVRREWLVQSSLFFLPDIYHEDEDWATRLLCRAKRVTVVNSYFYLYRQGRSGSITARVRPKHITDSLTVLGRDNALLADPELSETAAEFVRSRMSRLFLRCLIYLPILPDAERRRAALELEALRELCLPRIGGLRGAISRASVGLLGIRRAASLLCLLHRVKNRGGLV